MNKTDLLKRLYDKRIFSKLPDTFPEMQSIEPLAKVFFVGLNVCNK